MSAHHGNEQSVCPNCGSSGVRSFCPACGQSAAHGHPPTVGHFAHDLVHEVAHVDGTILRTIRALLSQPGRLTREYWDGHVVSWVRPIRVFLVAAAIHLFFATGIGPVNLRVALEEEAGGTGRNIIVASNPERQIGLNGRTLAPEAEQHELLDEFGHAYNAVRYLSPLIFAVACWSLYRRRQPYLVSHLILALHFYAFWYLLAVLAGVLAKGVPVLQGLVMLSSVYLALSLRRIFAQSWLLTIAKTAVLVFLLIAIEGSLAYGAIMFAERALGY